MHGNLDVIHVKPQTCHLVRHANETSSPPRPSLGVAILIVAVEHPNHDFTSELALLFCVQPGSTPHTSTLTRNWKV